MATWRPFFSGAALAFAMVAAQVSAGAASTPPTPTKLPLSALVKLANLLPLVGQTAQFIQLGSRLTTVNLQQRVTSVGGSPEALRNVMASAARGEVPVYDPRLGISKEEFGRYLAFQPILTLTGKAVKLPLTRDQNRVAFGDASGLNGVLKGIYFDLKTGELHVPEGFTVKPVVMQISDAPDRIVDIRSGFQWNLRAHNPDTQNGVRGQLSLFQLANGQIILSYKRTSLMRGSFNDGEVILGYTR